MSENESPEATQAKQRVSGLFDRAAPTYDHVGPRFFTHFGQRLVEIANIPAAALVLDVATGRGALLFPAAETVGPQGHVTGIDFSPAMVQETAREIAQRNFSSYVEVLHMDAEHLHFPDASFDMVLCGFAIFFFPQLERAMAEFRRVLKPDGRIAISTWGNAFEEKGKWLEDILTVYLPPEPEAEPTSKADAAPQPVFNTPEGLTAILQAAGFTDVQIFSEVADFIFPSPEEYWETLYSHGFRSAIEQIEQAAGADGLERFKVDILKQFDALQKADGYHDPSQMLVAVAAMPQSPR